MNFEQPKFPQSIEQSDRNAAVAFSMSSDRIVPGTDKKLARLFASSLDYRYSAKA